MPVAIECENIFYELPKLMVYLTSFWAIYMLISEP